MHQEARKQELNPHSLISYDLSSLNQPLKTKISQWVYGKKSKKTVNARVYNYQYPGLKDEEDVLLVSESTLLLPQSKEIEVIRFLEENNVPFKIIKVWK